MEDINEQAVQTFFAEMRKSFGLNLSTRSLSSDPQYLEISLTRDDWQKFNLAFYKACRAVEEAHDAVPEDMPYLFDIEILHEIYGPTRWVHWKSIPVSIMRKKKS